MSIKDQLSNLFGGLSSINAKELIGVDIGYSAVKIAIVSYSGKDKLKILNFQSIPLEEAVIIEDEIQKVEDVVEALQRSISQAKTKIKTACMGIFGPNTMTKRMQVPDGSKDEVEDHIMWESEQYVPFGVDDSEIVHQVLGENEGGGFDAIMAAARTDLIESFMDVLKAANLSIRVVDLNVFAICNLFEAFVWDDYEKLNEEGVILVDFGAQTTKVIVYKNGGPMITKEINVGGVLVTEEIQRQMGVSYEEAEDLKINGDESGNIPEEFVGIIDSHNENLIGEIQKVVSYYIQSGDERIQRTFVTGGSCMLPGLLESMETALDTSVEVLDPLEKFAVDKKGIPEHLEDLARTTASVAIGLSMRSDG